MGNLEIIVAVIVLVGIIGQIAVVSIGRRRSLFKANDYAKKRAELIEDEFDRQASSKELPKNK